MLAVFIAGMCLIIWGLVTQGWYMNEISAVFLAMGLLAGVIAGFSQDVIAQEFVAGIADFAFSAIVVGLARGILVIASDGMIIDTILNALATGLGGTRRFSLLRFFMRLRTSWRFWFPAHLALQH